jgi:hypothetical protein
VAGNRVRRGLRPRRRARLPGNYRRGPTVFFSRSAADGERPHPAGVASGEVARAITGHVTVAMTDHYAHVDTGEKKAAVEGCSGWFRPGRRLERPHLGNFPGNCLS